MKTHPSKFGCLIMLFLLSCELFAEFNFPPDPVRYFEQPFDVIKYDAYMTFENPSDKYIDGICTITFRNRDLNPQQRFYFHLWGPSIDSVFLNDERVDFYKYGDIETGTGAYFVNYSPDEIAQLFNLKIYYQGKMHSEGGQNNFGGVHYDDGVLYAMGVGFNAKSVSTTRTWLPCFDHPSDKAETYLRFDVPAKYNVASVGTLALVTESDNGRTVYSYKSFNEIATYLMTFAIGEFDTISIRGNSPKIVVYTKPALRQASEFAYRKVPEILLAYESYFGKYPFDQLGYVNTLKGSMEHQTMMNIANSVITSAYNTKDSLNSTIIHELAHQWFGNLVTPNDFRDVWINESFASFCEALIYEKFYGKERYLKHLRDQLSIFFTYGVPREGAQPLYDFDREKASNYPITIYYKGSNILSILRFIMGDSLFFGGINQFLTAHSYGNFNTADFIESMQNYSGMDLSDFFSQWIFEKGWIRLELNINSINVLGDEHQAIVTLIQVQDQIDLPLFETPIEFSYLVDGKPVVSEIINLTESPTQAVLRSNETTFSSISSFRINNGKHFNVPAEIARYTDIESAPKPKFYTAINTDSALLIRCDEITDVEMFVTDLSGRIISKSNNNTSELIIDKENYASGAYFVIIKAKNGNFIEKFVK